MDGNDGEDAGINIRKVKEKKEMWIEDNIDKTVKCLIKRIREKIRSDKCLCN